MQAWRIGDLGYYKPSIIPMGATWNPPAPGWKEPTQAEREHNRRVMRGGFFKVLATNNGYPTRAVFADGIEFDPSADIDQAERL